MKPPVLNKADMYRRLAAGEFGNTTEQFFDVDSWLASRDAEIIAYWGVRTLTPGGPNTLHPCFHKGMSWLPDRLPPLCVTTNRPSSTVTVLAIPATGWVPTAVCGAAVRTAASAPSPVPRPPSGVC